MEMQLQSEEQGLEEAETLNDEPQTIPEVYILNQWSKQNIDLFMRPWHSSFERKSLTPNLGQSL